MRQEKDMLGETKYALMICKPAKPKDNLFA